MGILNKIYTNWKSKTLAQKIDTILDIVAGAGCGFGSIIIGDRLSEGQGRLQKVCIKTAAAGLGLAAADISSKALKQHYGEPIATGIERAKTLAAREKAKAAEEKMKEAVAHE